MIPEDDPIAAMNHADTVDSSRWNSYYSAWVNVT
jgi:hypothetical protein